MNIMGDTFTAAPDQRGLFADARPWWNGRGFAVLAMLASMVPLLIPRIPPLVDLPGHMGRYRVMLGTDPAILGRWYDFHWRLVGNLGVDLLVGALGPLLGLEAATKLVILAIPPLTVLGILWVAREIHGRVHPFALFALPLVYSFPFQYGFVNYALALALGLNAFAAWLALGRTGQLRLRAILFVPLSCGLCVVHMMGWGTFGILVWSAELVGARDRARDRGRGWAAAAARSTIACLPLAVPLVLLVAWRSSAQGGETFGWGRYDLKLSWLAMILRDRWMTFDIATTAVLYLILYKGLRDPRIAFSGPLVMSALALLAVFAILPTTIFGSAYADMRLAPVIVLVALVSLKPGEGVSSREMRPLAVGATLLFVLRIAGTTVSYLQAEHDIDRKLLAIDHIPRGSVVVTMIGSQCAERWAMPRLYHLPGIALERRSIFANDQWLLDGASLLTVRMPAIGAFANDPSQLVLDRPCRADPVRRTIAASLADLPRSAIDFVWLVDPPQYDARQLGPATRVWQDGNDVVYRLDHRAPS